MGRLLAHYGLFRSLSRLWIYALAQLPLMLAAPLGWDSLKTQEEAPDAKPPDDPLLWIYLSVAVALVLLGGVFAGLTIALMGQDEIYLQVIKTSGEPSERRNATRVLKLLKRGKHWVLVTLLLSNVITNETLPIVLDRSLGGGWPAVLGSTVLIVIFGEVIPQSICVRYGLPIGAWMSPFVLALMWVLAPAAWPTAKLLDRLLGEDHGTVYKKAGLKTLVTLHKTLGAAGEQLTSDEVTIISAVLDLKEKPVGSIMTPMDDVFTMSVDTILDEETMDIILSAGYSRIPIHAPNNPHNFVGMLLVKMLITYDPEDAKPVRHFALATLPETGPDTSCLDIVNYFQEGKSHMVLVSEFPGEDIGALGVVTLEDVIEELIGEEIIDESDVFIDVHKAIRRLQPAPRLRLSKSSALFEEHMLYKAEKEAQGNAQGSAQDNAQKVAHKTPIQRRKTGSMDLATSPGVTYALRRMSGASNPASREIARRGDTEEIREHLKHLGPSNLASAPRETRYNNVKIKRKHSGAVTDTPSKGAETDSMPLVLSPGPSIEGGIGEGLLRSAGKDASDGVHALQVGYGATDRPGSMRSRELSASPSIGRPKAKRRDSNASARTTGSTRTTDTVKSLPRIEHAATMPLSSRGARSGSITENVIETRGFRKVVLETNSSGSDDGRAASTGTIPEVPSSPEQSKAAKKKKKKKKKGGQSYEDQPLLGQDAGRS